MTEHEGWHNGLFIDVAAGHGTALDFNIAVHSSLWWSQGQHTRSIVQVERPLWETKSEQSQDGYSLSSLPDCGSGEFRRDGSMGILRWQFNHAKSIVQIMCYRAVPGDRRAAFLTDIEISLGPPVRIRALVRRRLNGLPFHTPKFFQGLVSTIGLREVEGPIISLKPRIVNSRSDVEEFLYLLEDGGRKLDVLAYADQESPGGHESEFVELARSALGITHVAILSSPAQRILRQELYDLAVAPDSLRVYRPGFSRSMDISDNHPHIWRSDIQGRKDGLRGTLRDWWVPKAGGVAFQAQKDMMPSLWKEEFDVS